MNDDSIKLSMEMIASMVVYEMSRRDGIPAASLLYDFMCSKTAKALFDRETGMWLNGPDYVYEYYKLEQERRN